MAIRFPLLYTFVVVARSGQMRDAANTLSLTPGAISQRIRELEDTIGYRLFNRHQTGVELNAAGKLLFVSLDEPFRRIEEVGAKLEKPPSRSIKVSTMGSFAANWLVPRLPGFSKQHPDLEVDIETQSRLIDLRREPIDLAIRHGLGDYPGLESVWLMAPKLIVVASPELLQSRPAIKAPADCLAFPLLHDLERADWRLWLEAQGVTTSHKLKGPAFSDEHLALKAALSGQGLALVRNVYAEDDLRAGRLLQAIHVTWPTRFAYYAVCTPEALQKPAVRQFRDWLIQQASHAETAPVSNGQR